MEVLYSIESLDCSYNHPVRAGVLLSKMKTVACVLTLLALTFSAVNGCSSCAELPAVNPFDVSKFTGKWYQQFGLNLPFMSGTTCVQATYTKDGDSNVIKVDGSYKSKSLSDREIHGSAVLFNSSPNEGKFKFTLYTEFFGNVTNTFSVISTDYTNYAVFYRCSEKSSSSAPQVTSWIVTRSKELADDTSKLIEAAMNKVSAENGPSLAEFERTSQEFCSE